MLPLACVLLPSRFVIGCAGLWQLCDEVRTVGCRSRFVLLAQQANCQADAGRTTRTMWSAVYAYPTRPRKARIDAWRVDERK